MPKSVISQKMANPLMFPSSVEFSICLSSITLLRTSSLVSLSTQLIFSILLHIYVSNVSNLLSVCVNIHVSAAYSTTLQTKHFIILFFSSRLILSVNNISINTFFAISILLRVSFVQYPSSDIKLLKYLNWLTCSTCCCNSVSRPTYIFI